MRIVLSNDIRLYGVPSDLKKKIKDELTLINPKWVENERMGRWNRGTPKLLEYFIEDKGSLSIPRGFKSNLLGLCDEKSIQVKDLKRELKPADFKFHGKLKGYQAKAQKIILPWDNAVLRAPTGSGKTVMGLSIIASRQQPTLIIVHTKELLNQWKARINTFLEIPDKEIGTIGGGKKKLGEKITVGMVQSVYKIAQKISPKIGHLVIDECHRVPSRTFYEAAIEFDSKYFLGLSATPFRRDGMTDLISWFIGPTRHEIAIQDMRDINAITEIEFVFRCTEFRTELDAQFEYSKVIKAVTEDQIRNEMIADDAIYESQKGKGIALVISDRKEHCHVLQKLIQDRGYECSLLIGSLKGKEREETVNEINSGNVNIVVATGQLIGEGFDCPNLYALFITTPIRFKGRVTQYLGRILRPSKDKDHSKVYDYVDVNIPILRASGRARAKEYKTNFNYNEKRPF